LLTQDGFGFLASFFPSPDSSFFSSVSHEILVRYSMPLGVSLLLPSTERPLRRSRPQLTQIRPPTSRRVLQPGQKNFDAGAFAAAFSHFCSASSLSMSWKGMIATR